MKIEGIKKEEMIRLKAYFTQKYGIELDEWFCAVMFEMNQLNQKSKKEIDKATEEIKTTAGLLKGQMQSIHFKDNKQAFWFGFGKYLPMTLSIFFTIAVLAFYLVTNRTFEDKRTFLRQYPSTDIIRTFLMNIKIERRGDAYFIPLKITNKKGNISIGSEYLNDKENQRILIPLSGN